MENCNSIDKKKLDSIEKEVFDDYHNDGLPINIIDLAEHYSIKTLIFKNITSFDFKSKIYNNNNKIGGIKEDFILVLNTKDALEQRILVAYHLATFLMFYYHLTSAEETADKFFENNSVPINTNEYKLALALLCPKQQVLKLLNKKGYDKNNYREITNYAFFTKSFLVSTTDFVNRLQYIFEGDLNYE